MASVKVELDGLIDASVSGGHDPTLSLPDEIMVIIFRMVPFEVLWGGVLERVCQRWRQIVQKSSLLKRRKQAERWVAYEAEAITPVELKGHTRGVGALVVGRDGKIYSSSHDGTVRVWSGVDGTHLQTLALRESSADDFAEANVFAVGSDGKLYTSQYCTIRGWSGADGTHLYMLEGHTMAVIALAVGLDGKIYSGSNDRTIRVWSGEDGRHLQTLAGHTGTVLRLAVGPDGRIYSAGFDDTIRVWSGVDGALVQTLKAPVYDGETMRVGALAVGPDGKIYTGSQHGTIRVWSSVDGAHVQTLVGHTRLVRTVAVGLDGTIYSGALDGTIRVWSSKDGTLLHTFKAYRGHWDRVDVLVVGLDGRLYSCIDGDYTIRVW